MKIRKEVQGIIFDNDKILLVKELDTADNRYCWRLVKGGIERGETPQHALKREIAEETGLKNVQVLGKVHSYEFVFECVKHVVSTFLVKSDRNEKVTLQADENLFDFVWATKEEGIKMLRWENEKDALKLLK